MTQDTGTIAYGDSTDNSTVWAYWIESDCDCEATSTVVWSSWVSGSTTSSTVSHSGTGCVWDTWVGYHYSTGTTGNRSVNVTVSPRRRLTEAERSNNDRLAREAEERRKKSEKAEETAKQLLCSLIGEKQAEVYRRTGRLRVSGSKYDYIIRKGRTMQRLEKDNKISNLCVHLEKQYDFPQTDNVIALLLMLQGDEDEVLRLANVLSTYKSLDELPEHAVASL